MATTNVDANGMKQFVTSLSKSLQALCHGCMEFNKGIEMIGYINIKIDSENLVDCVLNEKVKKGSTNSLTFSSNSFLAEKERKVVTCDASCSPIAELLTVPVSRSNNEKNPVFSQRKRHIFEDGVKAKSGNKRPRSEHSAPFRVAVSQVYPQTIPSDLQKNNVHEPYLSMQDIKQEANEDKECSDISSHILSEIVEQPDLNVPKIKQEANEDNLYADLPSQTIQTNTPEAIPENENFSREEEENQNLSSNLSLENHRATSSYKPEQDQTLFEISSEQTASTSITQGFEHAKGSDSQNRKHSQQSPHPAEGQAEHPSFLGQVEEGISGANQFDVIEIADDDDEMHGLFSQSDNSHIFEGSYEREDQQNVHYNRSSLHTPSHNLPNDSHTFGGSFEREDQQDVYNTNSRFHSSSRLVASESWHPNSETQSHHSVVLRRPEGNYHCPHCPAAMQSRHFLYQHMQDEHPSDLPFTCRICGKGFLSRTGMKHHELAHSGRNFPCHVCDQRFKQKSHLTGHLRGVHHLKMCHACSQFFKLSAFNQHVLSCR